MSRRTRERVRRLAHAREAACRRIWLRCLCPADVHIAWHRIASTHITLYWPRAKQCLVFGYRLWGATRHRVVIPVVIPQFHLVGTSTLWRVAVYFAYPIIWHTAMLILLYSHNIFVCCIMLRYTTPRHAMPWYLVRCRAVCHVQTLEEQISRESSRSRVTASLKSPDENCDNFS